MAPSCSWRRRNAPQSDPDKTAVWTGRVWAIGGRRAYSVRRGPASRPCIPRVPACDRPGFPWRLCALIENAIPIQSTLAWKSVGLPTVGRERLIRGWPCPARAALRSLNASKTRPDRIGQVSEAERPPSARLGSSARREPGLVRRQRGAWGGTLRASRTCWAPVPASIRSWIGFSGNLCAPLSFAGLNVPLKLALGVPLAL